MEIVSSRIRAKEVAAMLGCAKSTVWSWVKDGYLPKPKKVGSRFTYWQREQIAAIAKDRPLAESN